MAGWFNWYGDKLERQLTAHVGHNVAAASIALVNYAKRLINVEGTAKRGKGKKAKLIYGANPSSPGNPPHKQTGRLLGSVAWELVKLVSRVGTNVKYGRWLELGTKKVKARPWLRRALKEMWAKLARLICRPMP